MAVAAVDVLALLLAICIVQQYAGDTTAWTAVLSRLVKDEFTPAATPETVPIETLQRGYT